MQLPNEFRTELTSKIEAVNTKNSILTPEDIEVIREPALEPVRQQLLLRNLRPDWFKEPIGWTEEFKIDVLGTMASARVKTTLDSLKVDTRARTRTTYVPVFFIHDFFIPRKDWEIAKKKGKDIVGKHIADSTYQCMLLEDQYLINGHAEDGTNKNFNGLYQLAGNTAGGADLGTYGNAVASVQAGITALLTDNIYGPYDWFLHPTQNLELTTSASTTGVEEYPRVNRTLDQVGVGKSKAGDEAYKRVYSVQSLTAGTSLMVGNDPEAVEIHETVPLTPELYDVKMSFGRGMYGRVIYGEVLGVGRDTPLCTVTGV